MEQNYPVPEEPIIFSKFASAITGPNGPVTLPDETDVSVTLKLIHSDMCIPYLGIYKT